MLRRFRNRRLDLRCSDAGATAIEYAIIGALIGIGLIGALVGTKTSLSAIFGMAASQMASGGSTAPSGPVFNANNPRAGYWQAKGLLAGQPTYLETSGIQSWLYKYQDGSTANFSKYKNSPLIVGTFADAATNYYGEIDYYNGVISSSYETLYTDSTFKTQKFQSGSSTFDANGVPTNQRDCTPVNGSCSPTAVAVTSAYKALVANSNSDFALFQGASVVPQP